MIFFKVTNQITEISLFAMAFSREEVKRIAHRYLGGDPDKYVVTPLTEPDDIFKVELVMGLERNK